MSPRESARLFCLLALALALFAAVAPVRADALAGSIGTTVSGLEWQLGRASRCQAWSDSLASRLRNLQSDPVRNATAIADIEARVSTAAGCITDALARASRLELALAELRSRFLAAAVSDASAALDGHVAALRSLEKSRASVQHALRRLASQVTELSAATPRDETLLAQKVALRDAKREELAALTGSISEANAALADFEATLAEAARTGNATLTWSVPTTRENGSPLAPSELGGYEIYVLSEATGETAVIVVGDPAATQYTVEGLAPDTYHFSMSAYDAQGQFSPLSDIVSKTVM